MTVTAHSVTPSLTEQWKGLKQYILGKQEDNSNHTYHYIAFYTFQVPNKQRGNATKDSSSMHGLQGAARAQISWCATMPNLAKSAGCGFCHDKPPVLSRALLCEGSCSLQATCWVPRCGMGSTMVLSVKTGR